MTTAFWENASIVAQWYGLQPINQKTVGSNPAGRWAHQEEGDHVEDEPEDDDRIPAPLRQDLAEDAEHEAAGNLSDADDDAVKTDLQEIAEGSFKCSLSELSERYRRE